MNELETIERIGTSAVKKLRKIKLANGAPFMINSKDLPPSQSYLEFPDKTIHVVTVADDAHSFFTIKILNLSQANAIRLRYNLL